MMVLETSFCVDLFRERNRGEAGLASKKLEEMGGMILYLSMFSLCELRAGAELSSNAQFELRKVEYLLEYVSLIYPDTAFPIIYGETEALLRRNGTPIPLMDLLIGCTAKLAGMPLLTRDINHFERIPGLVVETY